MPLTKTVVWPGRYLVYFIVGDLSVDRINEPTHAPNEILISDEPGPFLLEGTCMDDLTISDLDRARNLVPGTRRKLEQQAKD